MEIWVVEAQILKQVELASEGFFGILRGVGYLDNQHMGNTTSLVAELKAIHMGLQIAWNQGFHGLDF